MKNTYEESIPTGRTRQLSFKGMDSPKNLGQFITSKIKKSRPTLDNAPRSRCRSPSRRDHDRKYTQAPNRAP